MVRLNRQELDVKVDEGFTFVRHTGQLSDAAPIFRAVLRDCSIPGEYLIRGNEVIGPVEVVVTEEEILKASEHLARLLRDYMRRLNGV